MGVDAFIHLWNSIGALDGYCTNLAVFHTTLVCSVFLACKQDGYCALYLGRCNHIHRQHLVDLAFLKTGVCMGRFSTGPNAMGVPLPS